MATTLGRDPLSELKGSALLDPGLDLVEPSLPAESMEFRHVPGRDSSYRVRPADAPVWTCSGIDETGHYSVAGLPQLGQLMSLMCYV